MAARRDGHAAIQDWRFGAMTRATDMALEEREECWTQEVLESATERLRFAWTQGAYGETLSGERQAVADEDSFAFCVLGALYRAAKELGADVYTLRRAERLIAETIRSEQPGGLHELTVSAESGPRNVIVHWNDAPGRSKADVIAVVEHAAAQRASAQLAPSCGAGLATATV